jgi:hypothetical protein
MRVDKNRRASARWSTHIILSLFVITCALPITGTFSATRSRRSQGATKDKAEAKRRARYLSSSTMRQAG